MRPPQETRQERHPPLAHRLFQHRPGESVDLDDEKPPAASWWRRAEAQPTHEPIDEALEREHEVVEGHRDFNCIIGVP